MVLLVIVILNSLCSVMKNEKDFFPLGARHLRNVTVQQFVFVTDDNVVEALFRELFVFLLVGFTELLQALFSLLLSFLNL